MSEDKDILKLVCSRLEDAQIPYMLTGSFALNVYATPRMTRDIDIVVELQKGEALQLFQAFERDFYADLKMIEDAIAHQSMFNIIHQETVMKIDFIIRKNAEYRDTEFQKRRRVVIDNFPAWVVSPEDLIISKLFWARDSYSNLQLGDIASLFRSLKDLDLQYIEKWVEELNLGDVFQKVNIDE